MEQRAPAMHQRTLFGAISAAFQEMLAIFISSSVDLLHVLTGLPNFLWPCGFHSSRPASSFQWLVYAACGLSKTISVLLSQFVSSSCPVLVKVLQSTVHTNSFPEVPVFVSGRKQSKTDIAVYTAREDEGKRVHPLYRPYMYSLKLCVDHSYFRKSQEGPDVANPMTGIFLTWITQAALHVFSYSNKTSAQRSYHYSQTR